MEIEDLLGSSWPPTRGVLQQLLEEACVDTYDVNEQLSGIHCIIEEFGALPCACGVRGNRGRLLSVEARETALVGLVDVTGVGVLPIPLEDVVAVPGAPAAFLVGIYRLWLPVEPAILVEKAKNDRSSG